MLKLTTRKAVIKVLQDNRWSNYRLAQELGLRPIMITNYLREHKPSKMSSRTALNFERLFDIEITDPFDPRAVRKIKDDTLSSSNKAS